MKPFEINLLGENYFITPLKHKNDYQVVRGTNVLGSITPSYGDAGTKWTSNLISNDLAQQIGELIEEFEM